MLLDLFCEPSSLFSKKDAEPGKEDEEAEGGADVLELNWHCKFGMSENVQLIKDEFSKARGLKPIKILLSGPPCSGKSFFGQQLGEHYNVPHIHMLKLLEDLQCWDQEKEDSWNKRINDRQKKIDAIKA